MVEVVGHLTGDSDRDAVLSLLRDVSVRDNLVSGEADEADVVALREHGLVIHQVGRQRDEPLGPRGRHWMLGSLPLPALESGPKSVEPGYGEVVVLRTVPVPPADWQARLGALGAVLLERVGADRYVVRVPEDGAAALRTLPFTAEIRPYEIGDTVDVANVVSPGGPPPPGAAAVRYEVLVHDPDDLGTVRTWLLDRGLPEEGAGRRKVRFRCRFGDPLLIDLARRPEVAALDLFVAPEPLNDHAGQIIGLRGPFAEATGLTGQGQLVGVADTGVDSGHPDLTGRLLKVVARGRPDDASDPNGHGTHVAATLVGDGSASDGALRGAAPGALLHFQSIMDESGGLTGLPVDLNELLQEAYDAGVRIHNNSWGSAAGSVYRMSSMEIDEFVSTHPDMLVVVAAGNRGSAAAPVHGPRGDVDLFSIAAPATAKNALTVGASRSTRAVPDLTWGEWSPAHFPDAPIADEPLGGDPASMAAFSSRGPCQEHERIKPDVVAPGTCVLSARSATASDRAFWSTWDEHYAIMGGTSMAAPLVAGTAALAAEWFAARRHTPSAALLKATLVNGARWLPGRDALAGHATAPNCHQGFGLVDLPRSLSADFLFVDTWSPGSACRALPGYGRSVRLPLRCSGPLNVCLVWTDPPGRGVQHALNVMVRHRGGRVLGNHGRRAGYATADSANNVQVVRIDATESAEYVIEVTAISELLFGPQDFAVAVSCDLVGESRPEWSAG